MRAPTNATHREPRLIRLFEEARAKYPTWSHTSLLNNYVWRRATQGRHRLRVPADRGAVQGGEVSAGSSQRPIALLVGSCAIWMQVRTPT
jgi:hypothetical protein